ncbi:F0F1 ATP synthase subunit epsilon [Brevibacillus laterosporus]|uniref:F0F1 ATP synthase subunit epsilon n=1 Tax=Brevibacillus laterosporus TaxID=1465 RepID=UPI00035DD17A|nr:F0F1 ATP synthase subunit epsilon [Brevibacillus laterosporus]ATO49172.1 F0F1 ATP synthase subunit epsilon [Brevibacillus laterosporus DSM 25]AYB40744.1 F0F1 ATP synthase subunit epsilon [Brevibacillus laterosporus]MBG9773203.1 ATP synthase F1 subunit epsilon [Brevibacillus laterosporus]MBG9800564.1 ATP synthase F1 subunit epsilon [Brevibacillus laterosporus]MBG9803581.1 ATP synthase F1 subunit epsilon [Brevibacillus laterosporus]
MSKMIIEIVTPERVVYSGEATMVIARGVEGELGILPNHTPLVTPLKIAPVRIKQEGDKETIIAVSGGFMEVRGQTVTILAEAAEQSDDIDSARAELAKQRAEKRLNEKIPDLDVQRAEYALQRAIVRLDAARHK